MSMWSCDLHSNWTTKRFFWYFYILNSKKLSFIFKKSKVLSCSWLIPKYFQFHAIENEEPKGLKKKIFFFLKSQNYISLGYNNKINDSVECSITLKDGPKVWDPMQTWNCCISMFLLLPWMLFWYCNFWRKLIKSLKVIHNI